MGAEPTPSAVTRTLSRPSPSFRLRSKSLNTLRLRRVFDVFDHNKDGVITVEELSQALTQLGLETNPDELGSMVQCYIKAGGLGLEYDDFELLHEALGEAFLGVCMEEEGESESLKAREEADLTEAFKVFDEDGDGFISVGELQAVLGKLGLPEGREIERVQQMICSVDQNRDGRVDFHEFKHMMQSVSVLTS